MQAADLGRPAGRPLFFAWYVAWYAAFKAVGPDLWCARLERDRTRQPTIVHAVYYPYYPWVRRVFLVGAASAIVLSMDRCCLCYFRSLSVSSRARPSRHFEPSWRAMLSHPRRNDMTE